MDKNSGISADDDDRLMVALGNAFDKARNNVRNETPRRMAHHYRSAKSRI